MGVGSCSMACGSRPGNPDVLGVILACPDGGSDYVSEGS